MSEIIFEYNGVAHKIDSPEAMMKALGQSPGRKLVMVDEEGDVVGAGNSIAALNRSTPMVKAIRESERQPIRKAKEPIILFTKGSKSLPLAKSHAKRNGGNSELHKLVLKMEMMKKANVYINEADDLGNDDAIDDLYDRVIELEETVSSLLAYIGALSEKDVLPVQV
jgi:hypothetical protein